MAINEGKISVIIPVYNVEKYVTRCLDSVIGNTYKDLEIICVNDGSTDGSMQILQKYAQKDERIVILSKDNGGVSSARNEGISKATGEFLAFIDSDDWIHPNYFEILLEGMNDNSVDAVICGCKQVDEYSVDFEAYSLNEIHDQSWNISHDVLFHDRTYRMFKVYVWGVLFRREKVYYFFPDQVKLVEDNIFNLLNMSCYKNISIINLPLYIYYNNHSSVMHTYSCDDAYKDLVRLNEMLSKGMIADENHVSEIAEFSYKRCLFYRYVFAKLGYAKEAKKYTKLVLKDTMKYDEHMNLRTKVACRACASFPFIFSLLKALKGDIDVAQKVFSLAEGKLIEPNAIK